MSGIEFDKIFRPIRISRQNKDVRNALAYMRKYTGRRIYKYTTNLSKVSSNPVQRMSLIAWPDTDVIAVMSEEDVADLISQGWSYNEPDAFNEYEKRTGKKVLFGPDLIEEGDIKMGDICDIGDEPEGKVELRSAMTGEIITDQVDATVSKKK